MRIISGTYRGRVLQSPTDKSVRPTSDKVRGAIFNILAHGDWPVALFEESTRVLDAFCGSGALGLEALSRGAGFALFLDSAASSLKLAKTNAEALGAGDDCRFEMRDLTHPQRWREEPFQLLFLDPPYRKNLVAPALQQLTEGNFVADKAMAVIETGKFEALEDLPGWKLATRRSWGDTAASFLVRG